MEKIFSLESAEKAEGKKYQAQLLSIINDIEKRVRVVEPDSLLHKELHEKKYLDARKEIAEFEPVRQDVLESFGVADDPEHTYFFNGESQVVAKEQRALRAFFVIIDTIRKEGYYGEGRIDHITLFRNLVSLVEKVDKDVTFESIVEKTDIDPPQYLIFKGFLSIKDFKEISDTSRKILETPIFDVEGNPIETADNWFITGHSLKDISESKGD